MSACCTRTTTSRCVQATTSFPPDQLHGDPILDGDYDGTIRSARLLGPGMTTEAPFIPASPLLRGYRGGMAAEERGSGGPKDLTPQGRAAPSCPWILSRDDGRVPIHPRFSASPRRSGGGMAAEERGSGGQKDFTQHGRAAPSWPWVLSRDDGRVPIRPRFSASPRRSGFQPAYKSEGTPAVPGRRREGGATWDSPASHDPD
jgi:hypothetical protein